MDPDETVFGNDPARLQTAKKSAKTLPGLEIIRPAENPLGSLLTGSFQSPKALAVKESHRLSALPMRLLHSHIA